MRELPFVVNVTLEQEKIETEDLRSSLLGAIQATAQAIPQLVVQGQDPSKLVRNIATVIQQRQKGRALEDIVEEVFESQNPPAGGEESVEQPSVPPAPGSAPVGGPISQQAKTEPQIAGQVTQRPELQSLLSSLSASGKTGSSVRTINRRVVG